MANGSGFSRSFQPMPPELYPDLLVQLTLDEDIANSLSALLKTALCVDSVDGSQPYRCGTAGPADPEGWQYRRCSVSDDYDVLLDLFTTRFRRLSN